MTRMFTFYVTASLQGKEDTNTYTHVFPATHEHVARRALLDWYLDNEYHVWFIKTRKGVKRRRQG